MQLPPRKPIDLSSALPHDERSLEITLDTGRMGTFDWCIPEGRVHWSPGLERMHGYAPGQFAGTADAYFGEIHPDDRAFVAARVQEVVEGRREHHLEYRIVRPDGSTLWVEGRGTLVRDAEGRPLRLVGVCTDINDRKVAEAALRESETRYRALVEATTQIIWTADERGINAPSASWERFTGDSWPGYQGLGAMQAVHPADRDALLEAWAGALTDQRPLETRYRLRAADGTYRRVHSRGIPIPGPDGTVREWVGVVTDVEAREQAVDALRFLGDASAALSSSLDYETTLRTVARLTVPAIADWCAVDLVEAGGVLRRIAITHVDPDKEPWAWELEHRYPSRPEHGDGPYAVLQSGQAVLVAAITPEMFEGSRRDPEYVRLVRQLGLVSYIGVPLSAHGEVFGVLSLLMSESGRHYTDLDLRLAEEVGRRAGVAIDNARRHHAAIDSLNMLDAMLDASPIGLAFVDRALRYVRVNPALAALHGLSIEAHLGRRVREVLPAWAASLEPLYERVLATEEPILDRTLSLPGPDGGTYELLVNCFPVRDASRQVRWIGVTKSDVTEQRRAETALRTSEARFRRIVELPLIGIGFYHRDGRVTGANQALADLLGYTREEIEAGALRWDTNLTAPEYRVLDLQAGREVAATGVSRPYAKELCRKDGSRVPVLAGGAKLDETGTTGVFYILDLTERRRLEMQAQAAQRLEAVGRLAGGVAHEINNALQGVLGFNRFVVDRLPPVHPARADAEEVRRAGERAARITQQLLAYSRQQLMQPVDFDLAQLIYEFTPMLRQALGPERELVVAVSTDGAFVHADRTQLEQVLLNLTLNARDAMAHAGRLVIGVDRRPVTAAWLREHPEARTTDGEFVALTVKDDGCGMEPSVAARAFDPFFTTKPPGEGTGLGLAVVYGIVKQMGGYVWIDSEVGAGTTLTLLLPAVTRRTPPVHDSADEPGAYGHGTETVLLVDDEPTVRAVVSTMLRVAGYEVLEAADGQEALERITARHQEHEQPRVSLVLADIVMPRMGGQAFAGALAAREPAIPIVFMSGYTGGEAVRQGLISHGAELLAKPFTPEVLLKCVRATLDRRKMLHRI
jgi:two-component system, cell cycle sensor histidine kinase and response regulator CckA